MNRASETYGTVTRSLIHIIRTPKGEKESEAGKSIWKKYFLKECQKLPKFGKTYRIKKLS